MAKSLQDILKRRQQEEFVGREEQLIFFRRNLRYEPDAEHRRFVINISGQGGVGKTWLLRRFRKIAEEFAAVTAYADETEDDVPSVMGRIAEQFDARGHPLKTFTERYKVYRQRRQEIEADPDAPQGFPAFLGRTLAKGGLRLARHVPIGGVAADLVDEEAFASLAGDFASYVARKIGNRDEVRLVLEPVEILTPLFLADLRKVAKEHPLALFCDTYERTGGFLDPWLRDLLEGRHGDIPVSIVLVIAGRDELDRNHWAPYEGLLARRPLEPFTKEEAHDYLARKDITDQQVMEVIFQLSGRLPLLVATLAAERPDDLTKVGDPSGEAVERFLWWAEDPRQRQVALDAALPRLLNQDVLAVLVGEKEADALFTWLRGMPFIEKQGDGWTYHDVVRTQMLRYKRQEAPQGWANLHRKLAEYYEGLRGGLGLDREAGRKHLTWQAYAVEALYHRLCQTPQKHLLAALTDFVLALREQRAFARRWAEAIHAAGADSGSDDVQFWGQSLVAGTQAYEEQRHQAVLEMFAALLEKARLEADGRAVALASRGATYLWMGEYAAALADLNQALELDPDDVWAIAHRGATYRQMREYPAALADLDRALELKPNYVWAIATRGATYRRIGDFAAALADLDRAIELDPNAVWAILNRGDVYRRMGEYKAALADFNRAIELNPNNAWAITRRGVIYWSLKQYPEALADLNQAIEFEPNYAWGFAVRGFTYGVLGQYPAALADLDRAIELVPNEAGVHYGRGLLHLAMSVPDQAEADLSQAIRLARQAYEKDPQNPLKVLTLALYYLAAGEIKEAERLYHQALIGPPSASIIREAVFNLDVFLRFFPDHAQALAMRDLLQEHLQEAEQ
jgi:tetratricopeptide (TPR) repeat protein